VLNGNINCETQYRVSLHEIKHIINDMTNICYILGVDMHHLIFEQEYFLHLLSFTV